MYSSRSHSRFDLVFTVAALFHFEQTNVITLILICSDDFKDNFLTSEIAPWCPDWTKTCLKIVKLLNLMPVIHYAIFALISPRFYSLNKLIVEESQSQSADYSRQIPQKNQGRLVYYGHRRFFSFRLWLYPVGGYQTCLIFSADFRTCMFSFVMRLLGTKHRLHEFVVIGTTLKSGSDVQFSFVTIYKVGKCMMPSVSKICPDFKSCEVYSSL